MIPAHTHTKQHGFSLIELSIILIVLGVILAAFLPRMTRGIASGKIREAKNILAMARDEIIGMAVMNGTRHLLPAAEGVGGNEVPASIAHRIDPWGNTLYYYPASSLTNATDTCYFCETGTNATKFGKTVVDVAFLIGSMGKNFVQDLDGTGPDYAIKVYGSTMASGKVYDDIVSFVTQDYFQKKLGGHQRPGMPVTNSLLAWYPFDGDADDGSLSGFDGTVSSGSSPTLGVDRFGCPETMYTFGGTGVISVGNGTQLDFNSTDGFSVAFWIRTDGVGNATLVSKMNATATAWRGYQIGLEGGDIRFLLADNGTAPYTNALLVNGTESITSGEWTHFVATYDGVAVNQNATVSDVTLYIDGKDATASAVGLYTDLNGTISCPDIPFRIGGGGDFDLDEVAVFNSTLSAYEVEILYERTRSTTDP